MRRKGQFVKQRTATKLMPSDGLFSEFIRKRAMKDAGGCERCLTPKFDIQKEDGSILPAWKQLDCAHFDGRAKKSVRWDEDNACGLCGGCHIYLDGHPLEKIEFFKNRLGEEAFDMLKARMREIGMPDREMLEIYYTAKLRELDN